MDNQEKLATSGTQDINNGQSRETGNIVYTRHRTKVRENQRDNEEWTIQTNWQHWVHKTQDKGYRKPKWQSRIDNPKKLATLGTQDTGQRLEKPEGAIKNGQSKETGNIGYTRHRTKVREIRRGNHVHS
jgi:hypothetical protein